MRFSLTTKAFVVLFLISGVFFWQTNGAANFHAKTMDSDMSAVSTECTTSLPCITAIHVSPIPFIPLMIIMAGVILLALIISRSSFSLTSLTRFWLYTKKWRLAGGGTHLFDYLQNFLSSGLLQPKIAYTSIN